MKLFWYIIELDLHRPRFYRLLRASFVIFFMYFYIASSDHFDLIDNSISQIRSDIDGAIEYVDDRCNDIENTISYYHD